MRSQYLAERCVEKVRGRVVIGCGLTFYGVYHGCEFGRRILRQVCCDVYDKAVLLFSRYDLHPFVGILDISCIAYLAARITVEWRVVEYELVCGLAFRGDAAVTGDAYVSRQGVVSYEFAALDGQQLLPVVDILSGGVTRALLLHLEFLLKTFEVDLDALLSGDEFRKVDRESERVV